MTRTSAHHRSHPHAADTRLDCLLSRIKKRPDHAAGASEGGFGIVDQKPASMPSGVPSVWNAPGKNASECVMLATIGEELFTVMP